MKIIQVVGYKNSGKTRTVLELVAYFREQGMEVATLKHHGHGGVPLGLEAKDSALHRDAGAIVAGVEGDGLFQLSKPTPWRLEELIGIYRFWKVDVLIIEGFKEAGYEKILLLKDEKGSDLLQKLSNVIAVVTTHSLESGKPHFSPDALQELAEWLVCDWWQEKHDGQ